MSNESADVAQAVRNRYFARTPNSKQMHEDAKNWLPGGDTRTVNHFTPYPIFMSHGAGCILTDVDGNEFLDFVNNMGSMIHGHAHPALIAGAAEQFLLGTALGAPAELQMRHAKILCERVPSIERVRYCNSGTEATMLALRVARAFTGKDTIVKIDGGYHGLHNDVEVNMFAGMPEPVRPQAGLDGSFPPIQIPRGVPAHVGDQVFLVRYNDLDQASRLLSSHGHRIAAMIVEPMLGAAGCIPGDVDYLQGLRELTRDHDVLMILDECSTFRLGPLQTRYDIRPDLTPLCKMIGGGVPLGALGGRADIMAQFDPTGPQPLWHAGAFAGNNLALRVGIAGLETFGPREVAALNELGERLIHELPKAAREAGVKMQVTGIGSQAHLHWGGGPIRDAREALALRANLVELPELIHLELLNRGIYISRRGLFTMSTPMTDDHAEKYLDALYETLHTLRPYIAAKAPHLLLNPADPAD